MLAKPRRTIDQVDDLIKLRSRRQFAGERHRQRPGVAPEPLMTARSGRPQHNYCIDSKLGP
ncbi:hypothetical protein J6590_001867 [Homalodisca vitripennis]|nr:hypothetical protein J6590_001867 [Homalodisca vitripennis]